MTGTKLFDVLGFSPQEIQDILYKDEATIGREIRDKYNIEIRAIDENRSVEITKAFERLSNLTYRKRYIDFIIKYQKASGSPQSNSIYDILSQAVLNNEYEYVIYLVENVIDVQFDKKRLLDKFTNDGVTFNVNYSTCRDWIDRILVADCKPNLKFQLIFCFAARCNKQFEFSKEQLNHIQKNKLLAAFREEFKLDILAPILKHLCKDVLAEYLKSQQDLYPTSRDLIRGKPEHVDYVFGNWLEANIYDPELLKECFSLLIEYGWRPAFNIFEKSLSKPKLRHLKILADYERNQSFLTAVQVSKLFISAIDMSPEADIENIFIILLQTNLRGFTPEVLDKAKGFLTDSSNTQYLFKAVSSCLRDKSYTGDLQTLNHVITWFNANENWIKEFGRESQRKLQGLPKLFNNVLTIFHRTGSSRASAQPTAKGLIPISTLLTPEPKERSQSNVSPFFTPIAHAPFLPYQPPAQREDVLSLPRKRTAASLGKQPAQQSASSLTFVSYLPTLMSSQGVSLMESIVQQPGSSSGKQKDDIESRKPRKDERFMNRTFSPNCSLTAKGKKRRRPEEDDRKEKTETSDVADVASKSPTVSLN